MGNIKNLEWQKDLQQNITSAKQLAEKSIITESEVESMQKIIDEYPMSITEYYLKLIKKNDMSDPIYRMSIASHIEFDDGGRFDTSGEASNTIMDGIQHKYDNTVLLLSTNVCAMYCRHCFRKRLVGLSEQEVLNFTDKALDYIESHKEVDNVLITGGDAFLNSNKVLKKYLERLTKIDHIKFIRFGTRTPVVLPKRIYGDLELINMLHYYSKIKPIYVVTQFNHPVELTKDAQKACRLLRKSGVPVLNQTVLLGGVNDDADILVDLFNALISTGISPYYIFQCRPVKGVKNMFAIPLLEACDIIDETKARLSGVAKRFRFAMSHIKGKVEIFGKTKDNKLIIKQHQAKENDELNKIYLYQADEKTSWLPDNPEYETI